MSRLVLSAVATPRGDDFLVVVSVVTADDFHPRRGPGPENFKVAQLTTRDDDTMMDRPVAAVSEGPHGVYRLRLIPSGGLIPQRPGRSVLVVEVSAPPHGGGADYHGQTLTVGDLVSSRG
jgi:hypothetical protein